MRQHLAGIQGFNRLEKVSGDADAHRLLRVIKVAVAADDHKLPVKSPGARRFHQFKTVHARHADVRYDQVGPRVVEPLKRLGGVGAFGADDEPLRPPVNQKLQPFQRHPFIIHEHCAQH